MKTPEEINDELRERVDQEMPKPAEGFETWSDETDWKQAQEDRFIELCKAYSYITHSIKVQDIDTLEDFLPVAGVWTSSRGHDQISEDIAKEIQESAGFPVTVQLFRDNGEHLQGDERTGTMIVTRD